MVPRAVGVVATCFTDPLDPWSWAAEPARRRLAVEFGEDVRLTFLLVGLVRELDTGRARSLALATLDAAAQSGMPADARLWLRDPPRSTFPASIAFHAVAEQGDPAAFLRRVREAAMVEGRRMDGPEALLEAAREAGVGDLARLRLAFGSSAILERLGDDLGAWQQLGREPLPAVRFAGPSGEAWAQGWRWEDWRSAALAAGAGPADRSLPGVADALRRFGVMATAEVATVCGLPGPRAAAELWQLALEWQVTPRRVPGGELWTAAT